MNHKKQSRVTKLAEAVSKRKKELRLINRDNYLDRYTDDDSDNESDSHADDHSFHHSDDPPDSHPDIPPPSAGMIWDGMDYLTASDRKQD